MDRRILDVFYSRDISPAKIAVQAISREYGNILKVGIRGRMEPDDRFFSRERQQFDADLLLTSLMNYDNLFLWIIHEDMFSDGLNFVFGCAIPFKGAVLSTFRLRSKDLIEKEAVHEIGHVLGLDHCKNECVMMFSNSLYEAMLKPKSLCDLCKEKLRGMYGHV